MVNIKFDRGFAYLKDVAKKWGCPELEILEFGVQKQLKIWSAKDLRENPTAEPLSDNKIAKTFYSGCDNVHAETMSKIPPLIECGSVIRMSLRNAMSDQEQKSTHINGQPKTILIGDFFAITNEEINRFEIEHSIETGYPKELRIAVEIWREVFGDGIKPSTPPQNQHDMVRDALKPYNSVERIRYIIVADKSTSPVTEPTTTEHTRNEQGHPHHAPLLEIAVKTWKECKGLVPYKAGAETWLKLFHEDLKGNKLKNILELTNPNPTGGRPKKGT